MSYQSAGVNKHVALAKNDQYVSKVEKVRGKVFGLILPRAQKALALAVFKNYRFCKVVGFTGCK